MFYTEWTAEEESMASAIVAQVVAAVHACNSALKEEGMPFAFQLAFPDHQAVNSGNRVRVFSHDQQALVMFLQHERIKPLRRMPGVIRADISPAPAGAKISGVFVRARDADGAKMARDRNERKPKAYFEIAMSSQATKRRFALRIRLEKDATERPLNSYGLGGAAIPMF